MHDPSCWICMGHAPHDPPLLTPCSCPKLVHGKCLARWQLQKAGQPEETRCRFCQATLPDWRQHLGQDVSPDVSPTLSVEYQGKVLFLKLRSGQSASPAAVERLIKRLYEIPDSHELNLSFECLVPDSDDKLVLEGAEAFGAAMHCATMTAQRRQELSPEAP